MPTNTSRAVAAAVRSACSARSRSRTPRVRRRKSPSIITKRFMPRSVGRRGTRSWMPNPCVRGRKSGPPRCVCWAGCGVSMACVSSTSWWPMPGTPRARSSKRWALWAGPAWKTLLDAEPLRPGEEERAAALRLLGRLRRLYGVRFFDVVVADAWYAKGPFLKAVGALGWAVVVVLKQEDYDVYQEAWA